jgi:glycerophosphoryl diester phosphodiesterase
MRAAVLVLAGLSLLGCGSESEEPAGSGGAGGGTLDPASFDCATASSPPARRTPVPVSCATDRACTERLVSGHRSAGGELGVLAPENTLSAVRAAIAAGADFIETDPRPTKDGVLVNLHDPEVDRTTNGTGLAEEMTLAEVQALGIDASKHEGDFSCDRVPTLAEVLALAKGRIHVLLDANKTDRVDLLVQAVHDTDTLDWAIFDTDSTSKIQEALALEPKLHTMIRVSDAQEIDAELALFASHPPVIVELHDGADPELLAPKLHAAGHRVLKDAFGVDLAAKFSNDPAPYGAVFDSGVDIVQTDRPELVARFLGR